MTGWRIGYIGAPTFSAEACEKMQGQFTSAARSIAQKAAEAALTMNMRPTLEMQEVVADVGVERSAYRRDLRRVTMHHCGRI